jgi:hypothetical protein
MKRPEPSLTKHKYRKPYKHTLMQAWLAWVAKKLVAVKETLKANGWTQEKLDSWMYFQQDFFQEWTALPPMQLYWRVRAVFITLGDKVNSCTKSPYST